MPKQIKTTTAQSSTDAPLLSVSIKGDPRQSSPGTGDSPPAGAVFKTPGSKEENRDMPLLPETPAHEASDTPLPLHSLGEMEKIQAIGELSRLNAQLDQFVTQEIAAYTPGQTPPEKEALWKKWQKIAPAECSSLLIQNWADKEVLRKLDQVGIELARDNDLSRIGQARQDWTRQIESARIQSDADSVLHWEQLGKGIFYPAGEEERQQEITRRFSSLGAIRDSLETRPDKVLDYLKNDPASAQLPPTVKSYWETRARTALAGKQEAFYKTLIENELKGTPYREDMLDRAEEQQLIAPDRKKAYLERYAPDRPLRDDPAMALPYRNTLHDLINSYAPGKDIRGERKRSLYALIAESDCDPEEKGELLRQFARQRNNPELARLKNDAAAYIRARYERDGFGQFTNIPPRSDQGIAELDEYHARSLEKAWLASEEKLQSAQTALNAYLDEHADKLPSRREWQSQLPGLIYKATRSPRILFAEENTQDGYPLLVEKREQSPASPRDNTPSPSEQESKKDKTSPSAPHPRTWKETLNHYFSTHPDSTLKTIRNDLNTLYSQWLNRNDTADPERKQPDFPPDEKLI